MAEDKGKEVKKEGAGLVLAAVPRGRVGLTRTFPGVEAQVPVAEGLGQVRRGQQE